MAAKKADGAAIAGIEKALASLDVDLVGVAAVEKVKGTLLEEQVKKLLPPARSIIVLGMELFEEFLDLTVPERTTGAASMNDFTEKQSAYISGKLTEASNYIARACRKAGFRALPLPAEGYPYDARFLDSVFSYRHAAEAAGLGRIGYNALILTREYGPRVRFAVCLTEAALKPTDRVPEQYCRSCNICIAKCPSRALDYPEGDEPFRINKYACSAYLEASGGCWECVKQCPVASRQDDED